MVVLVKALPQPSKSYGETVCCAGLTSDGKWKRLFPVRFRHLQGGTFKRWDWVNFAYRPPTRDRRVESCHVYEDSIAVDRPLPEDERSRLLSPLITRSAAEAAQKGLSLTLVRPRKTKFIAKRKSVTDMAEERDAFKLAAQQTSIFDKELAELDPSPFDFRFQFEDDDGMHNYQNGDWETHAMFWRWTKMYSETEALRRMAIVYNEDYPAKGMVFALGNMAKRPQTWQLLGVLRLDEIRQSDLFG
ncbi:hypothetical protein ABIA99_005201 [Bradyrhizobium sp. LB12.1]|uniref:hypothetical protein n=1 Tax=Bradyrhizobium sp. LB12.1 TaxID=3156327 RepID=UPI00339AC312